MEIEHVNHGEVGKGTQKTHYPTHNAIGMKLNTQTSATYHQYSNITYHHNTWTKGWHGSHMLSPEAQPHIFPIFHT